MPTKMIAPEEQVRLYPNTLYTVIWQHPQLWSLTFCLMSPTPNRKNNYFYVIVLPRYAQQRRFYIQCTKSKTYTVFILHPFTLTYTSNTGESINPSQKETHTILFSIESDLASNHFRHKSPTPLSIQYTLLNQTRAFYSYYALSSLHTHRMQSKASNLHRNNLAQYTFQSTTTPAIYHIHLNSPKPLRIKTKT